MKKLIVFCLFLSASANAEVCKQWSQPVNAGSLDSSYLREASGLAVSRAISNRAYHMIDGDAQAKVTVTDLTGKLIQHIPVNELPVRADTEDLAYAKCGTANCIYIGNIGDNELSRESIEVLAFKEETAFNGAAKILSRVILRYPDSPSNAEAMIVHPISGDLFIFTKEERIKKEVPPTKVYKLRKEHLLKNGSYVLEKVGEIDLSALYPTGKKDDFVVTGADISEDGTSLLLVTKKLVFAIPWPYSSPQTGRGSFSYVSVANLRQPEAVSFLAGSKSFIVTSEAGNSPTSPILRFDCVR
jgi:hypothetical protein